MQILRIILNQIFPERDDHRLIRTTTTATFLSLIQPRADQSTTSLLPFSEPVVRAAIHETKFHQNERAVALLAEGLRTYLLNLPEPVVLIPIPLSKNRQKERGYNQVTLVLQKAVTSTPHEIMTDLLHRPVDTKPQTSLTKAERKRNVVSAFAVNEAAVTSLSNKPVIIIDDVTTTGATLAAARATLAPLLTNPLTSLALAH